MSKHLLLTTCSLAGLLLATAAQAENGTALTGKVTSAQELVMEGGGEQKAGQATRRQQQMF